MKFICLGYYDKAQFDALPEAERNAMFDACFEYDDHMRANGNFGTGEALQPPETASTLRWNNGKVSMTDGPFAETKETLGGLGFLEARDMDNAKELIAQHPSLRYGSIWEIRPVGDMSEIQKASAERRRKKAVR
jgi:hypothetical protein